MNDNVGSWWQIITGSRQGQTGRLQRLASPPPPAAENWPRAQKFTGELVPIFVFRSVAAIDWHVDKGFQMQPRQLADYLVRGGNARPAKVADMPPTEDQS
jgi:hypothetical protein